MKRPWLLLVLLAAAVPAAAAEMYTWTDANGVKHFSDSPPPTNTTKAQKLKVKGGVTTASAAEEAQAAQESSGGPALAAAAGYSPEDIKRNCDTAKRNLATLNAQTPFAADAAAVESHQAQVDKANQQIKLFCGH
ncbi:MAG: DUF4124 domain-containing protein [Rhodanobacteraceae bacterium]|jgi:hypothetical protein|nr:DUF4124 domain-containing protein [Rhodanobacteraceae bacterium]